MASGCMLTIPPETQNGQTFRLAGKGMPKRRDGGFGNLLVRVEVGAATAALPAGEAAFRAIGATTPNCLTLPKPPGVAGIEWSRIRPICVSGRVFLSYEMHCDGHTGQKVLRQHAI